jgi:peptide deformylase
MSKLQIVTNESILRKVCTPIATQAEYEKLLSVANNMVNLMSENHGVGIAAPQIGINKRFFFAILDGNRIELFMNPKIINRSEETELFTGEGCLSVPNCYGEVERSKTITMEYFNGREKINATFDGFNAQIVQHEYDHLDGVLFTDKAINVQQKECVAV